MMKATETPRFANAARPDLRLVDRLTEVAAGTLLVGILIVVAILGMRIGFDAQGKVFATALLWLAFMLLAPLALMRRLAGASVAEAALYAPCCLFALVVLMAVSYLGMVGTVLLACAIVASVAELRSSLIGSLPSTPRRIGRWLGLLLVGLLVVLELAGTKYGSFIADIVAAYGRANNDVYYSWNLANALRWFGTFGIGVDGVVPVTYYPTVHTIAARLAEATDADTSVAFIALRAVFLVPLMVGGYATLSVVMDRTGRLGGATAVALVTILGLVGNKYVNALDSETFALGLLLFSWAGVAISDLAETPLATGRSRLISWSSIILLLVVISITKSSVSLIFMCLAGYVDLRHHWRRPIPLFSIGLLLLAIGGTLLYLVAPRGTIGGIGGSVIDNFGDKDRLKTVVVTYATALFAICLSVIVASGGRAFLRNLVQGRAMQVELMIGCIAAATVPVLLFVMVDGGAANFTGVQVWWCAAVAIALLPAASEQVRNYAARRKPGAMAIGRLAGGLLYLVPIALLVPSIGGIVKNDGNQAFAASLLIRTQDLTYYTDDKKLLANADARRGRHLLTETSFWHPSDTTTPTAALVHALDELRGRYGRELAAYAPPDNRAFWNLRDSCPGKSLLLFGLSAVPLIDGLPPVWTGCAFGARAIYGLETLPPRQADIPLDDAALCRLAKERGFGFVYRIDDLAALDKNRLLTCS